MIQSNYRDVRDLIQPGDTIAFGGSGPIAKLIKIVTRSEVSHVATVLKRQAIIPGVSNEDRYFLEVIESTVRESKSGVMITRLSEYIGLSEERHESIWWLPLSQEVRCKTDWNKFFDWCLLQVGKRYDWFQAIGSGLDILADFSHNDEDFSRQFCSELCAGALEFAGGLPELNCSKVTPIDYVTFRIYAEDYYQLCGPCAKLKGWNSINPTSWGM